MTIVDTSGVITISPLVHDESGSIRSENNITSGSAGWFNIFPWQQIVSKILRCRANLRIRHVYKSRMGKPPCRGQVSITKQGCKRQGNLNFISRRRWDEIREHDDIKWIKLAEGWQSRKGWETKCEHPCSSVVPCERTRSTRYWNGTQAMNVCFCATITSIMIAVLLRQKHQLEAAF